ncbi:DNA recombinase [Pseudomonas sp. H3(2019)]|uniref:DNA recombinase n=1 Tax=Pseudomonas sp. H3(2019) TaxID=2598724 RepID=UPI0021158154|nr:DNA recombinase [Pseudomonas sp. H3(2019)]
MVEMATIRNRGEYQWEAQIRRKGYPAQRKTFETKSDAQAWVRMIESEIDRGIFVSRVEAERTAFHQLIDTVRSQHAGRNAKGSKYEVLLSGVCHHRYLKHEGLNCCDFLLPKIKDET